MPNDNLDEKIQDAQSNLDTLTAELTKRAEELFGETKITTKNLKEYTEQLRRQKRGIQEDIKSKELQNKIVQEVIKEEQNRLKVLKKQNEEAKKPGFWQKIGFVENPNQDQFKQLYRARQIAGGLETIAGGSLGYGVRQIASAFPIIANFMTGPYYLAIKGVTTALKLLDSEISKTKKEISSITGGVFSPYQNNYIGAQLYENRLIEGLANYGLRDKALEVAKTVIGSTPIGDIYTEPGKLNQNVLLNRTINQGASMNYMGSLGVSSDSIEKMFRISRTIEGMSETGALASQYRLAQRFRTSRFMTEGEGAQQSLALYEQTKSLGVNFEWASRTVRKFDEALQKGEATLNDFAAISRGVKSSDLGRSSGLAAMLKDFASRTGMELPEEFLNASDQGAGFYLTTRKGISDTRIQKALVAMAKEQGGGINFGSTSLDASAALQYWLSQGPYKANVSSDQIQKVINTGDWSSLIGGRGGAKPEDEAKQAAALLKESEDFYKNTRGYIEAGTEGIKSLFNQIQQGILIKIDQNAWTDLFLSAAALSVPGGAPAVLQHYKNTGQADFNSAITTPTQN